ncbi:hypothetical protein ACH4YO_32430 [Streptomyces noursei]|uniref:hypothetical protein n=1 Tax=Streptomyces noursei TaxID=1971 RepID=UPI0033E3F101
MDAQGVQSITLDTPAARRRAADFGACLALNPVDPQLREHVQVATGSRALEVAFDFAGATAVHERTLTVLAPKERRSWSGRPTDRSASPTARSSATGSTRSSATTALPRTPSCG